MKKLIFKIEKTLFRIFPRYKSLKSHVFGYEITIVDKSSFASMYEEIFGKEIYKMECNKIDPLIIDCGSNIGLSIIYFKQQFPNSKIIGFEPDPYIYKVLQQNIESAKTKNVTLFNMALSDKEETVNFFAEGADGGRIAHKNDRKIITVNTVSLRPYLDQKIDLLKIDIEGLEIEVIKDCGNLLKNVDRIFIEYHSIVGKKQALNEILDILSKNNFRYYIENAGIKSRSPFVKINTHLGYDLQLNISAIKI